MKDILPLINTAVLALLISVVGYYFLGGKRKASSEIKKGTAEEGKIIAETKKILADTELSQMDKIEKTARYLESELRLANERITDLMKQIAITEEIHAGKEILLKKEIEELRTRIKDQELQTQRFIKELIAETITAKK